MSPHLRDLLVNLSSVFAFAVGVLQGGQLQQTHAKAGRQATSEAGGGARE